MSVPLSWPSNLPPLSRTSYTYSKPTLNQRTDFAIGSRVRVLFPDGPDSINAELTLSGDQCAYLEGYYRYVLKNGALYFNLPYVRGAGTIATRAVRFLTAPTYTLISLNSWRVAFSLETLKGMVMSESDFDGENGGGGPLSLVYFGFVPTNSPDAVAVQALHSQYQNALSGSYALTQDGSTPNYPCFAFPAAFGTPHTFTFSGFTYVLVESSVSIGGVAYNVFINPSRTYAEFMNWSVS